MSWKRCSSFAVQAQRVRPMLSLSMEKFPFKLNCVRHMTQEYVFY